MGTTSSMDVAEKYPIKTHIGPSNYVKFDKDRMKRLINSLGLQPDTVELRVITQHGNKLNARSCHVPVCTTFKHSTIGHVQGIPCIDPSNALMWRVCRVTSDTPLLVTFETADDANSLRAAMLEITNEIQQYGYDELMELEW